MAVRKFKPTSPGRRFMTVSDFQEITKSEPEKTLLSPLPKRAGRNVHGRITTRHRGGGHKRRYRLIDFKRRKDGIAARVHSIEYDPNRSARIALLHYADGEKRYILAPLRLRVGQSVESGENVDIRPGNAMPLRSMPTGTTVHGVELRPGQGAKMVRSAGGSAQLVAKEGGKALLRLPSGEMRRVPEECRATVGQLGNVTHEIESGGKAGRTQVEGPPPDRPRHRHEPRRPPARRRRGQEQGLAPGHAVGEADARLPHAQQEEGFQQGHRASAQERQG